MENDPNSLESGNPGMDSYARSLMVTNPLREPLIREAIRALRIPQGSRGVDVGCGLGLQTLLLAEAIGPEGRVTGLDSSRSFVDIGRKLARKAGMAGQVDFREGDLNGMPFDDGTFDWLWSADCAGYPALEPERLMDELIRVVKPGGIVAILMWSAQMLLPGYPLLEARLNATRAGVAPFQAGMKPESHSMLALGWFREAGLVDVKAETLVRTVAAPLEEGVRAGLQALLEMRWAGMEAEVGAEDWAEYQRLCGKESGDFILNRRDYYAFFAYSMFWGKRQVSGG